MPTPGQTPIYSRKGNGSSIKPAPAQAAQPPAKPKPPEDPWFYEACGQKTPLDLHLVSGEMMPLAVITSISRYALIVRVDGHERLVMKHAIAWAESQARAKK
jgi:sRNA-binding regulator protein Hfq